MRADGFAPLDDETAKRWSFFPHWEERTYFVNIVGLEVEELRTDYARMAKVPEADKNLYAAADTGFISQNVYLFCASEGLGTVVREPGDRAALAQRMGLPEDQHA